MQFKYYLELKRQFNLFSAFLSLPHSYPNPKNINEEIYTVTTITDIKDKRNLKYLKNLEGLRKEVKSHNKNKSNEKT